VRGGVSFGSLAKLIFGWKVIGLWCRHSNYMGITLKTSPVVPIMCVSVFCFEKRF